MLRPAALLIAAGVLLTGAAIPLTQTRPASPTGGGAAATARERAYRANNLGVAELEQYNYDGAARSFREALRIDNNLALARLNLAIALLYAGNADEAATAAQAAVEPLAQVPQAHYVAGLVARAQGRLDDAKAAFRRVLQIDASDAGSRVQLGQILLQERNYADAAATFRDAIAAEPFNATAAYGLATALTRSGASEEGAAAMAWFEKLRDAPYAVTYSQTYLEQGRYGEAIASTGAEPDLVDTKPPAVAFSDVSATALPPSAHNRPAPQDARDLKDAGSVTLADLDDDGDLDLFAIDAWGPRLYVNAGRGARLFSDQTRERDLPTGDTSGGFGAVVGDYDNDHRADLLLLLPGGSQLRHQRQDGHFEDATAAAGLAQPVASGPSAAFVDIDHDGDLDVFIVGVGRPNQLLRNNGNGTFTEVTDASGMADGSSAGVAVAPTDFDNRRDVDLLVLPSAGAPRLYKNMRDGSFRDVAGEVGLGRQGSYTALAAADVNKDGFTDFFFGQADAPGLLMLSNGHGSFTLASAPDATAGAKTAQFLDYDNDGLLDLFVSTGAAARLFRNLGGSWSDVSEPAGVTSLSSNLKGTIRSVSFGDVDRDGDLDAALLLTSGELRLWRNDGGNAHRSIGVRLAGRVSNRFGVGAKVELRAGSLRQRLETSAATPAVAPADILFGLGTRAAADVVRVIWPSGTLQAETTTATTRTLTVNELDRKPSSCPFLYTWNGREFEFVTDFMGGGEIG
jgi:tetratricopeptide (TPR) repeat protein